jgi:uncharacterized protein YbbK (DUF523 family)
MSRAYWVAAKTMATTPMTMMSTSARREVIRYKCKLKTAIVEKILVSACLLGERVRYHGGDAECEHPALERWRREGRLIAVCPEVAGGLPTPRPPAEIVGPRAGDGTDVRQLAVVRTRDGTDVTAAYLAGADEALELVERHGIRVAILKDGSPSCGTSFTYDGTFSGARLAAPGVTAAMLAAHGVRLFSEREIDAADAWLRLLESAR